MILLHFVWKLEESSFIFESSDFLSLFFPEYIVLHWCAFLLSSIQKVFLLCVLASTGPDENSGVSSIVIPVCAALNILWVLSGFSHRLWFSAV